ncbi:MAG: hypothetical protein JWR60_4361 [Polaromonas sp.]|nr:hypothetical protein [Polaromonas sp.]
MKSKFFIASLLASGMVNLMGVCPAMAQDSGFSRNDVPPPAPAAQATVARIQQGLAAGLITPSEAQAFYRREREIQLRESQFKFNGIASIRERLQIRTDLNALNADIDHAMANRNVLVPPGNVGGTPDIDDIQRQIAEQINEAAKLGRLTDREARRLQSRSREIARHEVFFKSDGVVTPLERRRLRDELDALRSDVERAVNKERASR